MHILPGYNEINIDFYFLVMGHAGNWRYESVEKPEFIICAAADDFDLKSMLAQESQTAALPFYPLNQNVRPA